MIGVLSLKDFRIILSNLGVILTLVSPTLLIPIAVALLYEETECIFGFGFAFVTMLLSGLGLWKIFESEKEMKLRHAVAVTALAYLVIPLFSTFPFATVTSSFLDAYFEAVSGWTAAGLTTLGPQADTFPYSINLWRHLMQYVGGMGVVVLSLVVLSKAGTGIESTSFYTAEGRGDKIGASMVSTVRMLWVLYIGFLLICTVVLHFAGMSWFDAVNHSMSGLSTAGFSTHGNSAGYFDSVLIEFLMMLVMILGSMNFLVLYAVMKGDFNAFVKNSEHRFALFSFVLFLVPILIWLSSAYSSVPNGIRIGVFHLVSAFTTTGWMIESPGSLSIIWGPAVMILIAVAMNIGASTGSTSGGLKRIRIALIVKAIWTEIQKTLSPEGTVMVSKIHHLEEKVVEEKTFHEVFVVVFAYVILLISTILITVAYGYPFSNAIFEASAALSLSGLTSGIVSTSMPALLKIVYILNMWAGRLEVIPALIFIVSLKGLLKKP